jgi:Ran GTPase-activating protein (RanGAP) involved in mRNA processing and transport
MEEASGAGLVDMPTECTDNDYDDEDYEDYEDGVVVKLEYALAGLLDNTVKVVDLSELYEQGICDEGAVEIAAALQHNTSIHTLRLGSNAVRSNGTVAIAAALHHNKSLRTLDLGKVVSTCDHYPLIYNKIGVKGAVAIAMMLQHNTSLRTLELDNNDIGDDGAVAIGEALQHNTSLRSLDLQGNQDIGEQIGVKGATAIGVALQHNTSLQELNLISNKIGDEGAVAIGAALQHNTALRTLDLNYNSIGGKGAVAIGAALQHNTSLQELDLSGNSIGNEGAVAIGAALQHNTSLHKLVLSSNMIGEGAVAIGDEGAVAIGAALQHNTSLRKLVLSSNRIGAEGAAAIFVALQHNSSLQTLDFGCCHYYSNCIHRIGIEFLPTRRLAELVFNFDELAWPPPSISQGGRKAAVYDFLEALERASAPLTRSRVMFVGAGGAGKTTLKTALLLRGTGARDVLPHLRARIIETIETRWGVDDVRGWVDNDLASGEHVGFFDSLPLARGMTGSAFLKLTPARIDAIFGSDRSVLAQTVTEKMIAVLCFLKPELCRAEAESGPPPANTWWWASMTNALARSVASLEGFDMDESVTSANLAEPAVPEAPYAALLDIPHVWTEGVELDARWESFTL